MYDKCYEEAKSATENPMNKYYDCRNNNERNCWNDKGGERDWRKERYERNKKSYDDGPLDFPPPEKIREIVKEAARDLGKVNKAGVEGMLKNINDAVIQECNMVGLKVKAGDLPDPAAAADVLTMLKDKGLDEINRADAKDMDREIVNFFGEMNRGLADTEREVTWAAEDAAESMGINPYPKSKEELKKDLSNALDGFKKELGGGRMDRDLKGFERDATRMGAKNLTVANIKDTLGGLADSGKKFLESPMFNEAGGDRTKLNGEAEHAVREVEDRAVREAEHDVWKP